MIKTIMLVLASSFLVTVEDVPTLENSTGYLELKENQKVNLTIGKIQQVVSSGMSKEEKLTAKIKLPVVQIEATEKLSFVVKSPKNSSPRFALIKLKENKGKYTAIYHYSVFKPENNQTIEFIPVSFQEIKKEQGIYRMTVNQQLVKGRYVIVFGKNNANGFGSGFIDSKQAAFFDIK